MLIWKGYGILVPVIMFACFILVIPFADALGSYGLGISQFIAAIAIWFAGKKFNGTPGRVLQDPQTGEMVELKSTHSLFFIPMEYWAVIVAVAATAFLFLD